MNAPTHFIGVDGGATRTRARLRDSKGARLAEAAGAASNIHVDFAAAIAAMRAVVLDVLGKAGLSAAGQGRVALGFGLAGLARESDAERVGGEETIVGGRGFTLGDDGSGAHVGLDALRAAVRAFDGLGPESPLTAELIAEFGGDVIALTRWALSAKPGDYGAFAPRVFKRAAAGDPVALDIVKRAARGVEAHVRRAGALGAKRVALVGGIGEAARPYLAPEVAELLTAPLYDATDGAILLVGGVLPPQKEARS